MYAIEASLDPSDSPLSHHATEHLSFQRFHEFCYIKTMRVDLVT